MFCPVRYPVVVSVLCLVRLDCIVITSFGQGAGFFPFLFGFDRCTRVVCRSLFTFNN